MLVTILNLCFALKFCTYICVYTNKFTYTTCPGVKTLTLLHISQGCKQVIIIRHVVNEDTE